MIRTILRTLKLMTPLNFNLYELRRDEKEIEHNYVRCNVCCFSAKYKTQTNFKMTKYKRKKN